MTSSFHRGLVPSLLHRGSAMRHALLAFFGLLSACDGEPTAGAPLPDAPEALATPFDHDGMEVRVGGSLQRGAELTVEVWGAPPGATVEVAWGLSGSGPCPPALLGGCLDIVDPAVFVVGRADARGRLGPVRRVVPLTANLTELHYKLSVQAYAFGPGVAAISPRIVKIHRGFDFDLFLHPHHAWKYYHDLFTSWGLVGDFRPGSRRAWWYNDYYAFNENICGLWVPVTLESDPALTPCPGCDYVFRLTPGQTFEVPTAGDCAGFLGGTMVDLPFELHPPAAIGVVGPLEPGDPVRLLLSNGTWTSGPTYPNSLYAYATDPADFAFGMSQFGYLYMNTSGLLP